MTFLGWGAGLYGQQIPTQTQYYFNHYAVNPAATGTTDDLPLSFSYRKMWAGISESPSIQYLSGHMRLADDMGAGAKLFNYTAGPLRKTGAEFTYSYHLQFANESRLAFGLSALLYQFNLNRSELTFEEQDDLVLSSGKDNMLIPDASFGTYYYADNYFVGLSVPQLLGRNIDLKSDKVLEQKQVRHYNLMGGYTFVVNRDITFKPSMLLKFIETGVFQADINALMEYQETFIGGISYRSSDALIFQFGFNYEKLFFGYSYDMPIAGMRGATFGSHEVLLRMSLPNLLTRSGN